MNWHVVRLYLLVLLVSLYPSLYALEQRSAFDGEGYIESAFQIAPDPDRLIDANYRHSERTAQQAARKLQTESTPASCDLQLYDEWKTSAYAGILLTDAAFWRYQTQLQFVLSNGLALELAVAKCLTRFKLLTEFKAGKAGPVPIQYVWKAMCTDECMQSDVMHEDAMTYSGCSCLELSTNITDTSYVVEGDWCLHNSAKMLCDTLGFCGIWGCRIDDFMCPRYEWNKKIIPLKGPGHCDRDAYNAAPRHHMNFVLQAVLAITVIVYLVMSNG